AWRARVAKLPARLNTSWQIETALSSRRESPPFLHCRTLPLPVRGPRMRAVVQRVSRASVTVAGEAVGEIGPGLLVLLGGAPSATRDHVAWMAEKVGGLRIFRDADDKMNLSVQDVTGGVLVVSQFTLFGDCAKGKRPSFIGAARPEHAIPLY